MDSLPFLQTADLLPAVLTVDAANRVISVSEAWLELLQLPEDAVLGSTLFEPPLDSFGGVLQRPVIDEARRGTRAHLPQRRTSIAGRDVCLQVDVSPTRVEKGTGLVFSLCAVSAEEDQADRESSLSVIFANAPIGIALLGLDAGPLQRNPAMKRIIAECTRDNSDAFPSFTHPDDLAAEMALFDRMRRGESDFYQMEKRFLRRNGEPLWVRLTSALVRDSHKAPRNIVTMVEVIDDRKRAQEALQESEARFRRLAENAPDMIFRNDFGGPAGYSYVSPAVADILGYDPAEFYADPDIRWKLVHPEDRRLLRRLAEGHDKPQSETVRWRHKDGHYVWVSVRIAPVFDAAGRLVATEGIARDVTEMVKAEEALKESEERFRTIFENGPVGVTSTDVDGRLITCNPAFAQLLGYEVRELVGRSLSEYTHPADFASQLLLHLELVEGRRDRVQFEKRVIRKDGTTIWVRTTAAAIRPGDSRPPFVISMVEDITERRQAEEARQDERRRLRSILQTAHDGFCIFDNSLRIIEANDAYCWMSGYSQEELLSLRIPDLEVSVTTEDSARWVQRLAEVGSDKFETRHRRKDGRIIDVEVSARYLRAEGVVFAFLRDVTERNMMESALRESERRYRQLFDRTADALLITDLNGRIIEANSVARERLGYSREELLGKHISVIDSSQHGTPAFPPVQELHGQGRAVFETMHLGKSGLSIPTEVNARLIEYEGQKAVFSICRDITERKLLQEQLNRAQRLETAGRVAGQVAHDFNNLLGPMAAYPELIKMELPDDHRAAEYCEEMSKAARIMADINSDMLVLSRRGLLNQEPVNLNDLVKDLLGSAGRLPETLTVNLHLSDALLPAGGVASQLMRVVSNLVSNAREAMQDQGILFISTENVTVKTPFGRYDRVEPGDYVVLTVGDTGCGIPHEIRERIFDPFFSTKRADKRRGSGLGLAIVHSVIEDHKGYIDLESESRLGSTFRVYLPVFRGNVAPAPREVLTGGSEEVLVVDDDPLQRKLAQTLLERMGYRVETVSSGEDAVLYLRDRRADVVLLDMVMEGGIDGAETYRRISEFAPRQKAIIMSGFAESDRVLDARSLGVGEFLMKPLTAESLGRALRQELDRR